MPSLAREAIILAKELQRAAPMSFVPPSEGRRPQSQQVIPHALVSSTRGYIERIVFQINGCYEHGWFDACAVMMRRMIETLIIECFESHGIDEKIKNPVTGDFLFLADMVSRTIDESSWNLARNTKRALPKLKYVGDQSAHSRRYIAYREDIDKLVPDFRCVCQELIYLARLK